MKTKQISKSLYRGNTFYIFWAQNVNEFGEIRGTGWFEVRDKRDKAFEERHPNYRTEYYIKYKNKILLDRKEYHQTKEGKKVHTRANIKYYQSEKGKIAHKKGNETYWATEKGKAVRKKIDIKCQHKRRGLGFIELNQKFEGSHAHHIDMDQIIYIPMDLHKSIWHNIWTGQGMEEINRKAFAFLILQLFETEKNKKKNY